MKIRSAPSATDVLAEIVRDELVYDFGDSYLWRAGEPKDGSVEVKLCWWSSAFPVGEPDMEQTYTLRMTKSANPTRESSGS